MKHTYQFYGFFFGGTLQAFEITRGQKFFIEAYSQDQAYLLLANKLISQFAWSKIITQVQLYNILKRTKTLHCEERIKE